MKKNPEIVQICEKYDNEKQKEELIAALKKICGSGNQNDFDSSEEDTKKTNTNTAEGVNF
jgi:hypothetical protein